MNYTAIEIVPAILRRTYEGIAADWQKIHLATNHIQIDVTDGIFAGDGSFRELRRFKQLPRSEKIELHLMVHTPSHYVDDIIDLQPARCIFHLEAFSGTSDIAATYRTLRNKTQAELALAINPTTPTTHLLEQLPLIDYVMFMGYNPGWANQPLDPTVYNKIRSFAASHPKVPIAVDGHVNKDTIAKFAEAGVTIFCANTAIFGGGDPVENIRQLELLAQSAVTA